ncbi:MAG: NAD(P)H-dependent oxidoreductase subunit E [Alphaproteobacteria bacterium]|jgi:formate dehydrogenase|nr:NAD(P)H-dependent oxidoreductase subunit E [Alphaproteobacteria bacterium]HJO88785.1 NAD(P)H-dependent oxidoreductase subunit E [Alphaproteobacteria bacterium]
MKQNTPKRDGVPPHPKGLRAKRQAFYDVQNLLGDLPRKRDMLLEFLHLVQDEFHCLSESHLVAVAHELRLSFAEVYEVATFYAHFDVIKDNEPAPPLTVRVCDSLTCEMSGAKKLLGSLIKDSGKKFRVVRAPCMGRCDLAPVAEVGRNHITRATIKSVRTAISEGHTATKIPDAKLFETYKKNGGYTLLQDCLAGERTPNGLIKTLEGSKLKGMGGAGFPAGTKWRFVRKEPGPHLMTVNADEGEPGTFKDRFYLDRDPHRFLEGMLIAAWAVEATDVYIYLRDEYPGIYKLLKQEIFKLEATKLTTATRIHLRRGAGAYICGEESAMMESIEGKRGLPRHRPPYVSTAGLFGRPTLNHNVETLHWVRDVVEKGADWFASQGRNGGEGLRSYSISGRVREPGMKLAPSGITMNELLEEYCGGMAKGHKFKAYLPGGASGGILPASLADIPLDFGTLEEHGCFIGSAGIIVLSDKDNIRDAVLNLMSFLANESCGQCTPCRVGTEKAVKLLEAKKLNRPLMRELCATMADASICGLGQAAGNPVLSMMKHFNKDFA